MSRETHIERALQRLRAMTDEEFVELMHRVADGPIARGMSLSRVDLISEIEVVVDSALMPLEHWASYPRFVSLKRVVEVLSANDAEYRIAA